MIPVHEMKNEIYVDISYRISVKMSWNISAYRISAKIQYRASLQQMFSSVMWSTSEWNIIEKYKMLDGDVVLPTGSWLDWGILKGTSDAKFTFFMVFELKCVLAVCVHNHHIMIKIHPCFFLNLHK